MLLYGVTFAEDLEVGDVLVTSPFIMTEPPLVAEVRPNMVKRIDKSHTHQGGVVQVEMQTGEILVLSSSQSVIVGREPTLRDVP